MAGDLGMDIGLIGLKDGCARLDGDLFGQRSDLQLRVRAGDRVDRDFHVGFGQRLEPGSGHLQVVGAGQQIRNSITPVRAGGGLTSHARGFVGHRDGGAGYSRASLIFDHSHD